MEKETKRMWSTLKTFDWKMFLALCMLSLIPAIYQTVVTKLITANTQSGVLDIIGQMEWFDLIDETICAFLIIPMYSLLSKARATSNFNKLVFKFGIIILILYVLFSLGTFFYGISLIGYMNPNEIDLEAVYHYLSLETLAFMVGIVFSYTSIVFLVIDKAKYMYLFLIVKIMLSLLTDFVLIPNLGINGVAISNILINGIMGIVTITMLVYLKEIAFAKFQKEDFEYFKAWLHTGLFAGGQQFLDNIIYALMIVRMVNAVSESGNYWVANNFIWGWLLIPITCLSQIIRKDAGVEGYRLKQKNYYLITTITIIAWFILIPTYKWFFRDVEGIENYQRVFIITVKNLVFYIAYAFSQIPDAIFVGMGKTKYNAINSLFCNIVYYGTWFLLYLNKVVNMNMDTIIIMFGLGNVVHWLVSLIEEKYFLTKNNN